MALLLSAQYERDEIGGDDRRQRAPKRTRSVARSVVDLTLDGGRVVPADVVPERNRESAVTALPIRTPADSDIFVSARPDSVTRILTAGQERNNQTDDFLPAWG
jgi:hypothetical protein